MKGGRILGAERKRMKARGRKGRKESRKEGKIRKNGSGDGRIERGEI